MTNPRLRLRQPDRLGPECRRLREECLARARCDARDLAVRWSRDLVGPGGPGDAGFFDPQTGHLRIIDRAKDVGRMADGSMFAPKYVENTIALPEASKRVTKPSHPRLIVAAGSLNVG